MTEVIVMEDGNESRRTIKHELEKANFKVKLVDNREQAVKFAKEHRRKFFILDVNMGQNRDQEGLDTLEKIKEADPNAFVSVLSAHPRYEAMSKRLKADMFVLKTARLGENVQTIIPEMIKHELHDRINTIQDLEGLKRLEKIFELELDKPKPKSDLNEVLKRLEKILELELDPNIEAYEKQMKIEEWQEKYQGQYVAFVDGEFVDYDRQKEDLFKRLQEKYPEKNRYVKKIGKEEMIIDLPYFDIVD